MFNFKNFEERKVEVKLKFEVITIGMGEDRVETVKIGKILEYRKYKDGKEIIRYKDSFGYMNELDFKKYSNNVILV